LGDMFWRTFPHYEAIRVITMLNGEHCYVKGNHEELFMKYRTTTRYFESFDERSHIYPAGGPKHGIALDHYAGRTWYQSDKGAWQLYGHSHGELPDDHSSLSLDVGVDAHNYYPISIDEVRAKMEIKMKWMRKKLG
jgi:calcineurin-like phosphoesterase family protein